MNKETARELFMDYLYDELNSTQKKELEQFLSLHPHLQKELEELSDVRSVLSHLPVQEPARQFVMMEPGKAETKSSWDKFIHALIPQNGFALAGYAVATCLILFAVIGAFTQMSLTINDNGFNLAFREPQEVVQQGFTAEQVEYLLQQLKEENALMVSDALQTMQENQDEKLEQTFIDFARFMEQQRTRDLQLISSGLNNMEETYYDRFEQTDLVLNEIIQTVSRN